MSDATDIKGGIMSEIGDMWSSQYREFLSRLSPEQLLDELLAVIHRDGGHYTEKHGRVKSVADAMDLIQRARME